MLLIRSQYPFALDVVASESANELRLTASFTPAFSATDAASIVRRAATLVSDLSISVAPTAAAGLQQGSPVQYDERSWNDTEAIIRGCVADVCNVAEADVTKNIAFLRLGVDSITGIRLAQRLRSKGINTRSADILRFPSVGALARFVAGRAPSSAGSLDPSSAFAKTCQTLMGDLACTIPPLTVKDRVLNIYPATALQSAMLTSTLASGGTLYVVSHPLELDASVDLSRLRSAWLDVVKCTDILRTTFHPGSDYAWLAAVHLDVASGWSETSCSEDKLPLMLRSLSGESAMLDINDFAVPLYRVWIIVTPTRTIMIPIIHHA